MGVFKTKQNNSYKSIIGGLTSSVSSIFNYSQEENSYEVFTRFTDDKRVKGVLNRKTVIMPADEIKSYSIEIKDSTKNKSGLGRAAAFGLLAGGAAAIVGATTGKKEFDVIKEISITINSKTNYYTLPIFMSLSGEKISSSAVIEAKKTLERIVQILEQNNTTEKL